MLRRLKGRPLPGACRWGARPSDAVRALGLLAGGVDADGGPLDGRARRVDGDAAVAAHVHRPAVHAPGGRTTFLLADPVVLGAVAGALEPLRRGAPGNPAPEVGALL